MRKYSRTITFTAILLLALVVVFLFSGPHYFSNSVSFLDTELSQYSGDEKAIRVKMDFDKQSNLEDFPYMIGQWKGRDEDSAGLKESLGAKTLIKRAYTSDSPFQPTFLLIMQSASKTTFHPPVVCYPALGYEIEEETKDVINMTDTSWVSEMFDQELEEMPEWFQNEWDSSPRYGKLAVKKLIISHKERIDRRVVLYIYITDKKVTSDTISMVRVSTLAPPTGSVEEATTRAGAFMGEVIPILFEPEDQEQKLFITYLSDMGIGGYFIICLLLAVPMGIISSQIFVHKSKGRVVSQN